PGLSFAPIDTRLGGLRGAAYEGTVSRSEHVDGSGNCRGAEAARVQLDDEHFLGLFVTTDQKSPQSAALAIFDHERKKEGSDELAGAVVNLPFVGTRKEAAREFIINNRSYKIYAKEVGDCSVEYKIYL
ncbi:MAG: hypothetical protein AAFR28_17690, partial [Pseudomonadota bacterium]